MLGTFAVVGPVFCFFAGGSMLASSSATALLDVDAYINFSAWFIQIARHGCVSSLGHTGISAANSETIKPFCKQIDLNCGPEAASK
jgi:hypothetical protein